MTKERLENLGDGFATKEEALKYIDDNDISEADYYDVVVSICTETCRTDSDIICGGFATKEEALKYIDDNDISEADYYSRCRDDETAYIEIEERDDETGAIVEVITVD